MASRSSFGSIRKLPSKRFQASYAHPAGTGRVTAPVTFTRRPDAASWLTDERKYLEATPAAQWEHPQQRWERRQSSKAHMPEYVAEQIQDMQVKPTTRDTYESIHLHRIKDAPDLDKPIDLLSHGDIVSWVGWLNRSYPTPPRNIDAWNLLNRCVRSASRQGLMDQAIMTDTKSLLRREVPTEKVIPTLPQLQIIVESMPAVYTPMIHMMAWCGLRLGEARELRGTDLRRSGSAWAVRVSRSAARVKGETIVGSTKTDQIRTVTIPPALHKELQERLDKLESDNDLLFFNSRGDRVQPSNFREQFSKARKKAGCPEVTPHSLRHFAGTIYATTGATIREIMDRLGHKDMSMAMHYQHVAETRTRDLLGKLDSIITGAS